MAANDKYRYICWSSMVLFSSEDCFSVTLLPTLPVLDLNFAFGLLSVEDIARHLSDFEFIAYPMDNCHEKPIVLCLHVLRGSDVFP